MTKDPLENPGFKRALLTGFIALFPIVLTVLVLQICIDVIARVSKPLGALVNLLLVRVLGFEQAHENVGTFVAVILAAVFIYVLGRSLAGIFGRRFMGWADVLFSRLPVVSYIYPHAKHLSDFLFGKRKINFNRVVAIEYPRRGIYTIGFVTSEGIESLSRIKGRKYLAVFVPTSPTPFTGWTVLVEEREVLPVNMTVDEAMRFTLTCGVIAPGSTPPAELADLQSLPSGDAEGDEQERDTSP